MTITDPIERNKLAGIAISIRITTDASHGWRAITGNIVTILVRVLFGGQGTGTRIMIKPEINLNIAVSNHARGESSSINMRDVVVGKVQGCQGRCRRC